MKTFLKIVLLLAAVFMVAGSLFFFAKTRMKPPTPMEEGNLHEKQARVYVESIKGVKNTNTLNNRFYSAMQLLAFLGDNKLIDDKVSDQLKEDMVEYYVPTYAQYCMERLATKDWEDKDIKKVAGQVAAVKGLVTSDGELAIEKVSDDIGKKLDDVDGVVCLFDSAVVLAGGGRYTGWQNAKKRMGRADRFANNTYLRHNPHLVESLDSFKLRVERSHFNLLIKKVEEMERFSSMEREQFDSIYNNFNDEYAHYADSAKVVYGSRSEGLSSIKLKAERVYSEAWYHFSIVAPVEDAFEDVIDAGRSIYHDIFR